MSKKAVKNQELAVGFLSHDNPSIDWVWVRSWSTFIARGRTPGGTNEMTYRIIPKDEMMRMIYDFIITEFPTVNTNRGLVEDVAKQCEWLVDVKIDEPPLRYIAMDDAVYDMEEFEFVPKEKEADIITVYSVSGTREQFENEKTPFFDEFLRTTLVHENSTKTDESLITVIQEMIGNVLLPDMEGAAAFFLVGDGSNGKSVLIYVIRNVIGPQFCTSLSIESLTTNRFSAASLVGKRLNICAEEESKYLRSDKFKVLVTGDSITAERKFGGTFDMTPAAKFIFATNSTPTFDGLNHGLARRIIIVPFHRRFGPNDRIPRLGQKIVPERMGILRWAIEGAKRLRDRNYQFSIKESAAIRKQIDTFEEDSSSVVRFVKDLDYKENREFPTPFSIIYADYTDWCKKNGGNALNSNNFSKELTRLFPGTESFPMRIGEKLERVRPLRKHGPEL